MKSICISAISSNQGKTLLSMALLHRYKKSVRAFKIGPDFIDPQFHEAICKTPSINLDTFLMNEEQVKWLYSRYSDKEFSILEGVMGFYDGDDKGCSAHSISSLLDVPTLLVLDGSGSYITVSAVLHGLKGYMKNNTIKGVVLNKISSKTHYEMIKDRITRDFKDSIKVLGWIEKDLESIKSIHLGLDLRELNEHKLEEISNETLKHIDLKTLEEIAKVEKKEISNYPFDAVAKQDKFLTIIKDENFSFLYHDNLVFLKEIFKKVEIISAKNDETIDEKCDAVMIPGGYIEIDDSYKKMGKFKTSLIEHVKRGGFVYAECAGLIYLSNKIDDKPMSGLLNMDFKLNDKRVRLGYYYSDLGLKGHAFHYSSPINPPRGEHKLSKTEDFSNATFGAWRDGRVYGTYLHVTLRNNMQKLGKYFGINNEKL